VTAGAFALLQDLLDRALSAGQVGHGDQLRPAEMRRGRLRAGRTDEQPVLPTRLGEVREARLDRPVQVPDRREVLPPGHDVPLVHHRCRPADRGQAIGVGQVHSLRPLQEHEVAQRLLAERQQRQLHARRVMAGGRRQVRPGHVRRGADRRQQVVHQGQVQHLLGRHA
jgi:hypothetical protein